MRLIIALTALVIAGCAAHPMANNPDYQQCEYEAMKATPGSNSVLADALRQHELTQMCMRNKGYR